jgi:hypothetical protein
MSSTDFTTRPRDLGGDQQLLLPALAESRVDFGLRMWVLNLRSPRTVETYAKTMMRFRAFMGGLGYDLDGDRRIVALTAERWCRAKHLPDERLLEEQTVGAATFNQRLAAISSFLPTPSSTSCCLAQIRSTGLTATTGKIMPTSHRTNCRR